MRKAKEFNLGRKLLTLVSAFVLVLTLGILAEPFSMVSNAQTLGKVVVRSANIRQEADAASTVVGSAAQGASVTINGETTGTDGNKWYQVFVDADTLGYIRSDLIEVVEGNASTETPATTTNENMAEVTAVEPMSATISGSQSVRVRSNASTGSQIVTSAQNGLAITVNGTANGTDGKLWYQVSFISEGATVSGFIRSDYVTLSGDLVPATTEPENPVTPETPTESEPPVEPEVVKDWDTELKDGTWKLIDNIESKSWDINTIFDTVNHNQTLAGELTAKTKLQTIIIIILVIVILVLGGLAAVLFFKIKDMKDSAYFAQVERETMRRRSADRPAGTDKKVMHTVGAEKRPAGARPAGAPGQGEKRPSGARPVGAPGQGEKRPAGARPVGAPGQGEKRPAGARPAAAPGQGEKRPAGAKPAAPESKSAKAPKPQQNGNQDAGWKSKNFMTDDDEFEFEFLNWDGEEE